LFAIVGADDGTFEKAEDLETLQSKAREEAMWAQATNEAKVEKRTVVWPAPASALQSYDDCEAFMGVGRDV
jgi:hypothetical protein